MVRLTDRPDMTLDVYRGRKTTTKQTTTTIENYSKDAQSHRQVNQTEMFFFSIKYFKLVHAPT